MSFARPDDKCLEMARTFFPSWRILDAAAVSDARYMIESLQGTDAAMTAIAIACNRLLDDKIDETRFWMRVYRSITGANTGEQESTAIH